MYDFGCLMGFTHVYSNFLSFLDAFEIQRFYLHIISFNKKTCFIIIPSVQCMYICSECFIFPDVSLCRYSQNIASSSADYLCEILERELSKNHEPEDHILPKVIEIITESRAYGEMQAHAIKNFVEDCVDLGLPKSIVQLYLEM